jgi:uncharacterized protein involved in exopolysaccharide biosynthesis
MAKDPVIANRNSSDILYKFFQFRKILIAVSIFAAIASAIVSFIITPEYKAAVVLFPAPSDALSKSLISTHNAAKNTGVYGEEPEVERLLQTLHSDEIRRMIVWKYDLHTHYDIDTAASSSRSKMAKAFNKRFKFSRTPFMAVEVLVYDKNPELAAKMANDIPFLLDSIMNSMEKKRQLEAYRIVREEFEYKQTQMKEQEEKMKEIMKKGIYDFESQSEVYNKAYAEAIASGNARGVKALEDKLDILSEYGGSYIRIRDFLLFESENLAHLSARLKEAKLDAEQSLSHAFVINQAEVPDKKARPLRSIIVATSTISAFVLCFVFLLLMESFKAYREETSQV